MPLKRKKTKKLFIVHTSSTFIHSYLVEAASLKEAENFDFKSSDVMELAQHHRGEQFSSAGEITIEEAQTRLNLDHPWLKAKDCINVVKPVSGIKKIEKILKKLNKLG